MAQEQRNLIASATLTLGKCGGKPSHQLTDGRLLGVGETRVPGVTRVCQLPGEIARYADCLRNAARQRRSLEPAHVDGPCNDLFD
jgi:hypothetical protein